MNDRLTHRGPDGSGMWRQGPAAFAHRRLKVIDLTDGGAQPMVAGDHALVYNGEIYNDHDLRQGLEASGTTFRSTCDTETLFALLHRNGPGALGTIRGMYALGWVDLSKRTLILARDPMGIKPLYYWRGEIGGVMTVVFASEPTAILEHPAISAAPDPVGISTYLTTLRTSLDDRTMFEGIKAIRAGETIGFDLDDPTLTPSVLGQWSPSPEPADVLGALRETVGLHLRADVPTCCLLSGGLDSTLVCAIARERDSELSTYCAGAEQGADDDDLSFAHRASEALGVRHVRAPVDRGLFLKRWPEMVRRMGVPMSTPNEVAINEVARVLRSEGKVVALSGEGADELFAGYEAPISLAAGHVASGNDDPGVFQLRAHAWLDPALKLQAFQPRFWAGVDEDAWLFRAYRDLHEQAAGEAGVDGPMEAHLRMHRRVNLTGLLGRLDTATMLESVEGRTPYADRKIADLAASIPFDQKATMADAAVTGTKLPLRNAGEGLVPSEILSRPKASFPLPFQGWIGSVVSDVLAVPFLQEVYTPGAIAAIASDPATNWNLAWPMANLAIWGEHWWGR